MKHFFFLFLILQSFNISAQPGPLVNEYGVRHNAVAGFNGTDYLIFHAYAAAENGRSKLRIEKMFWFNDWPVVGGKQR